MPMLPEPLGPENMVRWSELADPAPAAALLGMTVEDVRRCAELLARAGAAKIVLRVAEANAAARTLYEAEGWSEVSRSVAWRRELDLPARP